MRIPLISVSALVLSCSVCFAQTPSPVQQYNADIQQLNGDIRNNEADVRKDSWDARHDQADINRDRDARALDQSRERHDLADGDFKGAKYWGLQSRKETGEIRHDEKDLAHSDRDVRNAKERLAKDISVRNHDVALRNRARR
jgi:hypothetical protein